MSADDFKRQAAAAAIDLVKPGMILGLGTGTTSAHFITLLGERISEGLQVTAAPTSEQTARRAAQVGIDLIEPDEATVIDLAVDGCDEIDPMRQLIKGGGGALLREKIIAHAARRFVVIADQSKRVAELGAFPLPVEIDRFCFGLTVRAIRETLGEAGFKDADVRLRPTTVGPAFISDGGNFILDCRLRRIPDPDALDRALSQIPGVVETGLFIRLADEAIIAGPDGVSRLA